MDWTDLMALHGGYEPARILQAAVWHDLFTHLVDREAAGSGPVAAADVAQAADTDPRATELLLNALVTMGLVTKAPPADPEHPFPGGGFRATRVVRDHLVDGAKDDFRPFIRYDAANWEHWGRLPKVVEEGGPALEDPMFQSDADAVKRFIDAMEAIGQARGDAKVIAERVRVPESPTIDRKTHILDVGGGAATYTRAFLQKNPGAVATIVDLPATLEVTRDYLTRAPADIASRIRLVPCDYNLDTIPYPTDPGEPDWDDPDQARAVATEMQDVKQAEDRGFGYDLAWVSNIIHGEDETNNRALAENLHHVLRPGGRVAIKEHIMASTLTEPGIGGVFGVTMLLFTEGGRVYGFDEVRRWYEDAGFFDVEEVPPTAPLTSSLVFAKKAE